MDSMLYRAAVAIAPLVIAIVFHEVAHGLAARALGFDCGPMSGFDNAGVDAAFFAGTTVRSNFICSIGHGDPAALFPRNPRLSFEEAGNFE